MTKQLVLIVGTLAMGFGFSASPVRALAPEQMSYQGVLVQNNGIAVPNGVYNLRFRLFDHPTAASTLVFEQTLQTQVTSGLYNVILSNNGSYDLGDIAALNTQLFMEVTVLVSPPITLLPRQQLASVPFALAGPPAPAPPPPPEPGIVEAHLLSLTTETSINANAWTAPSGLSGLTLDVPAATCVVEVRAEVVVGSDGGTDSVGVRLEQSYNGGAYSPVRGPVIVTTGTDGETAVLSYVASSPNTGTYVYRVAVREESDGDFEINPNVGSGLIGPSQSTLSGKLWCP